MAVRLLELASESPGQGDTVNRPPWRMSAMA